MTASISILFYIGKQTLATPCFSLTRPVLAAIRHPGRLGVYNSSGITLLELLIALAIVTILVAVALPNYTSYIENQKVNEAKTCLLQIELSIERYKSDHPSYPENLSAIPLGRCQNDPWGNPYRYLKIAGKKGKGGNRKDRSENPLNTDYDLYSMGKDGHTEQSLRPPVSHDDIIRAKNGGYIGLAADY